jgi:hypothetical protein
MGSLGWLDDIESGHFETELLSLSITKGTGERFSGQGFLSWSRDTGAEIRAITDGSATLDNEFRELLQGRGPKLGQIIPDAAYARLEALTLDGQTVTIDRLHPDGYTLWEQHPSVVWRIDQSSVGSRLTVTKPKAGGAHHVVDILLSNAVLAMWPRRSTTNWKCLEATSQFGAVCGSARPNGLARVNVEYADHCDPIKLVNAISVAFSFLAGRMVYVDAYELHGQEGVVRALLPRPRLKTERIAFYPPLGSMPDLELSRFCEPLLAKAIDFFYESANDPVATYLNACLSTRDAPFSAQSLIACTCLEGLAKGLARQVGFTEAITNQQKEQVTAFLKKQKFEHGLIGRFSGFMGKLNEKSGANAISEWAAAGFLGFDDADKRAWRMLRNQTAHGNLQLFGTDFDTNQEMVSSRDRVHNMINKLILHAIGFTGQYFDYATWKPSAFPSEAEQGQLAAAAKSEETA